ncbi:inositol-3-phosphate synthase [Phytomonospora endophytica]|uniref:Myo-inositol-1-phosphate synthase n=1 Tax=Phytomonospora endophytica TaxID=714109 RepID=A0A841FKM8_9ACTN|nr:inositol-3-phosphate synthase [Phytomonospora endophytica]MBB6036445.1 myo-inositol-1-phosphate synthase [Phytomonospora endophytica]GIG65766.1 inositol-3-phosphate synthase [Phytomonospora endophytica]
MIDRAKVAVIGVGNGVSALLQGIAHYRATGSTVGIGRPVLDGFGVGDIDIVAAFAMSAAKVGTDLAEAILMPPNNYPRVGTDPPPTGVTVQKGLSDASETDRVAAALAGAEVLLYAAPSGRPDVARAYAEAALRAGAAFVNTTSDAVARDPELMARFEAAGLPLLGDDLSAQLGASIVHRALLRLLEERGLTLDGSYQITVGGTEDIRNLAGNGESKTRSKLNAVTSERSTAERVEMAPIGYLAQLGSQKAAYLNIEARGWAEAPVSLDVKLKVHDASGGAGVVIDLLRMAAGALRAGRGGHVEAAAPLLKSPPGTAG